MQWHSSLTATVYRTERDGFGDPIDSAGTVVDGCAVIRHDTSEDRDTGEQVTETATLAAPADADIRASDDVEINGVRWHVDGRPRVPHHPLSGWQPALTVPLRKVTG